MRLTIRRVTDSRMYPYRDVSLNNPYTLLSLKKTINRQLDALLNRMTDKDKLTIVIELDDITEENKEM